MNAPLPIPASHRTLVDGLRRAFHDAPADPALAHTDWGILFRQAQEHGVHAFLYPWLTRQLPYLFSPRSPLPKDDVPAAWRARFLQSLSHSSLRRNQLSKLFSDFGQAGLAVIPLKGAWLSETVYDDPAQRTMSDVDLLVRSEDLDAAHAHLLARGYRVMQNTLHNPFSRDQSYLHDSYPWAIELHWDFASEMSDAMPPPDLGDIWENSAPGPLFGQTAKQLSLEDCVSLLAYHLLGHRFALPLRAHLDLALLLRRFGGRLSPEGLKAASARWKTGAGVPFLLRFTSELFEIPLPPALAAYAGEVEPARLAQACQALFHLPQARDCGGEETLLQFKHASWPERIRLVARRIFMPQAFLVMHYPCARTRWGLPLAWLFRASDLVRNKAGKLAPALRGDEADSRLPSGAENREKLVRWLLTKKNGPA